MPTVTGLLAALLIEPVPRPGPLPMPDEHPLPRLDMDRVADAVETAMELPGARFGIAVADLGTGDTFVRSDGGLFDACGVRLVAAAMRTTPASAGAAEDPFLPGAAEIERWLETEGPGSTFLSRAGSTPGAPVTVMTIPGDALEMLGALARGLGSPSVREEFRNPLGGTPLEDLEGDGTRAYGVLEHSEGSASFAVVAVMPGGRMAGIVVLADMLCCPEKADLAFRLIWESL